MKKLLLIFSLLLGFANLWGQTLSQTMYIDFGPPTGCTTCATTGSPDANGHYWNNPTSPALNASTTIVNGANASTGYTLLVTDNFAINTTNNYGPTAPSSATLGDLAVASATQDYFFLETSASGNNTGAVKFTGLNQGKRYKFTIFASRINTDTRVTSFSIAGYTTFTGNITTTNGAGYVSTPLTSDLLQPNTSGEIAINVGIVSGGFGFINAVKVEEYDGPLQSVYIDLGPASGCASCATTPAPDANGRYWNNPTSGAANATTTLVNSSNASTGYSMAVTDNFVVNTTINYGPAAPASATLGDLAIGTATQDYFYLESTNNTGALKFTGLNLSKAYRLTLFGSRVGTDTRVTSYSITGNTTTSGTITTTNGNSYTGGTIITAPLQPNASGEIALNFGIVSGNFGYINIIKIEEYNAAALVPVTTINVTGSDITATGQTQQMAATISPANATYNNITWSVNNTAVATISSTGLLTPVSGGTVTVTATSVQNPSAVGTKVINVAPQTTQLYFSGSATENGDNPATALAMKMVTGTNNVSTGVFEIYTSLTEAGTFRFYTQQNTSGTIYGEGASAGTVAAAGAAIDPTPTGPVRITVNLTNNTYTILPINWSVVGSSIPNNWGGDEPLTYQGGGIWQATVNMNVVAQSDPNPRFIFRANQDWNYQMKKLYSTNSGVMMASQASTYGDTVGDIDLDYGNFVITLNLTNYTYSVQCTTIDQNKISFMGSSGMNGQGATNLQGYAYQYNTLLANRTSTLGSAPFYRSNISINGNNTTTVMARWEKDLIGDCGKYVAYGLVLGNEGIHETGQTAYNSYSTNLQLLIQKARDAGKVPMVMNNYGRGDYNATDYNYIKQMNVAMAQWDVPSTNMLGAMDNGTGNWVDGYWDDYLHPNTAGHTELFYAQVPSLFDALEAGKALPTMATGTFVTPQSGSTGGLVFTPQNTIHPFTTSFDIRTHNAGTLMSFTTGSGPATISINNNGYLVYTSPAGTTITGNTVVNDGAWHKVTLTHYYAWGKTFLYNGTTAVGSLTEQLTPVAFSLHGNNGPMYVNYRNWFFWRSGMNALEIEAVNNGLMMKSSLELYAPLDGQGIYSSNPYANRAQSINEINASAFMGCAPAGDQLAYGQNEWKGYLYSGVSQVSSLETAFTSGTYSGYITQPENFDQNVGAAPLFSDNICGSYADYFSVRYKMQKTYAPGYYFITVGADDAFRLSLDGGATFNTGLSSWNLQAYTEKTGTVYLDGTVSFVLEYYENTGASRVYFNIHPSVCPTAPESISGGTLSACATTGVLTAQGGTAGDGATYQWGTGSVAGENIIAGQTGATITVSAVAQTYWVRRYSVNCTPQYTDAATTQVAPFANPGNPAAFGDNAWNVYVYSGSDNNDANNVYSGYYTQNTLGFSSEASWAQGASPSSATNWQGCTVPVDNFTFTYKRKGFPCGNYALSMLNWDDNIAVYIDGSLVWSYNGWSGGTVTPVSVGTFALGPNTEVTVRVVEFGGGAHGAISLTEATATAPSSINVTGVTCAGSNTTLTAMGATLAPNEVYEWGTGTIGSNVFATTGQAGIVVPMAYNTTYWVRVLNTDCGGTSAGVTYTSTVAAPVVYNGSWSSTPDATSAIDIQSDYTMASNFEACSVTVSGNAVLTVNEGVTLTVNGQVSVAGTGGMIIQNNGALLQTQDIVNTGAITFHKSSNPLHRLDYTLWSAPITGQTLRQFSLGTSNNRFYVYAYDTAGNGAAYEEAYWPVEPITTYFAPAKAYLIRMPNSITSPVTGSAGTTSVANYISGEGDYIYDGTFNGVPNNGSYNPELSQQGNRYTAVGNPYPSPISLSAFLTNNSTKLAADTGIWFWRKRNGSASSYVTLNLSGLAVDPDNGSSIDEDLSAFYANAAQNGSWLIAPGQGFLVQAKAGLAEPTLSFTNSMRRATPGAQAFFRQAADTASRYWLNMNAENGSGSQALVAYIDEATLGLDYGYDSKTFTSGISLYSVAAENKLTIQARPEFEVSDVVPMGFTAPAAGTYTITLDHMDGIFANGQTIYLKDLQEGITRNLNLGNYTFTTEAGTFEGRFEVHYQTAALGIELQTKNAFTAWAKNKVISIEASEVIANVALYDITGRLIYQNPAVNSTAFATATLAVARQVVIVKVTLANGATVAKKLILE
jgi:Bacterial Ig-like domain (group 2)/GDSL-like Lipase/Acylhydrolase family